ncbi:MAG: GTPase [Phycisphaeraceae bacterium]
MTTNDAPRVTLTTAANTGPIALIQLHGPGVTAILTQLTGKADWPASRMRLVEFAEIDTGLAVMFRGEPDAWAQLMPHGGPRVVQKLLDHLTALGAAYDNDPPPRAVYPEAKSDLEADMLATIARAASPAAINLLLAQPGLWKDFITANEDQATDQRGAILARSDVLDRLIDPPAVVVIGRPNVGKSTLTNRMLGRSASLVADLPGTTRDWVAGLAELDRVAVRWMDTPGLRHGDDEVEQRAIDLARQVIVNADVLIAMRDPSLDWPTDDALGRGPDLWVFNKIDTAPNATLAGDGRQPGSPLPVSAATGRGTDRLQQFILDRLGLSMLREPTLWVFSPTLRTAVSSDDAAHITSYVLGQP